MTQINKDRLTLLFIYIASFAVGIFVGNSYFGLGILGRSALIIFATVLVIWLFSFISDNSSVFDPYWSVAPAVFIIYFWYSEFGLSFHAPWFTLVRFILLFVLVTWWGTRLTFNFLRGWKGMKHEDWRYVNFRKTTGVMYWAVSFLGIQLFPAFMVYTGCLSIWTALTAGVRAMNLFDILGILITGMAIWLETKADRQLHDFAHAHKGEGKTIDTGLWSISRHPNYLGEISFWWGLWFFAFAANPQYWWVIIGPVAMTLMFVFVSIPMIEKRLLERKSDYAGYRKRVPMLLPFKRRYTRPS
jgi:steroid 5-alpha reductase family enzyme